MTKRHLSEAYAKTCQMLLERFGEPIGKSHSGEGVDDERNGRPRRGVPMGNRGFGSQLDEVNPGPCQSCGAVHQRDQMCEQGLDEYVADDSSNPHKSAHADPSGRNWDSGLDEGDELDEVTPPGEEKLVRSLKHKKGVKNPWALAWSIHNKKHGK